MMESPKPFLFRLTKEADELLEKEFLFRRTKKNLNQSKSEIINRAIIRLLKGRHKHDNVKSTQTPT